MPRRGFSFSAVAALVSFGAIAQPKPQRSPKPIRTGHNPFSSGRTCPTAPALRHSSARRATGPIGPAGATGPVKPHGPIGLTQLTGPQGERGPADPERLQDPQGERL